MPHPSLDDVPSELAPVIKDGQPCPDGPHRHPILQPGGANHIGDVTIGNHGPADQVPEEYTPDEHDEADQTAEFEKGDPEFRESVNQDQDAEPDAFGPEWTEQLFDLMAQGLDGVRELATRAAASGTYDDWAKALMALGSFHEITDRTGTTVAGHVLQLQQRRRHPLETLLEAVLGDGASVQVVDLSKLFR